MAGKEVEEFLTHLAKQEAEIHKKVSCHTFRHSFATHLFQNGYDIPTV